MNTIVLQFDNVFVFVHLLRCLYLGILWLKWVSAGLCVSLWGTGGGMPMYGLWAWLGLSKPVALMAI